MRVNSLLAAAVVVVSILAQGIARADLILLNDGSMMNGELKKAADGWFVTDAAGKVTHVSADRVKSIQLSGRGDAKDAAAERLASLRRAVEAFGDPKVVVDRYEKFVEANKGQPIAAEAAKDLAQWRERVEKGMARVAGKWVGPEERAALQEKSLLVVDQARELLKQNKLRDADAAVSRAMEVDPTNVSALYLKGLIAFRQDNIPVARKSFEAVREAMPDYGPALNNLAVILWRQNQHAAALNVYLQAMQAMPLNKEVLNNVAEAINALTEAERKGAVAQKVMRLYAEQDAQLQQQMNAVGWYRWGATWVDKAQFTKLEAAEREVKAKIAKMEDDFADAQTKLDTIDSQMEQNRLAMRAMEQNRLAYDGTGKPVLYPLPPQYYDYDRANRRLEIQRAEALKLIEALRAKAQVVKAQLPQPKFNGVQLAIGVEGTPAIAPTDKVAGAPAAAIPQPQPAVPDKVEGPTNLVGEVNGEPKKDGPPKPDAPKVAEKPLKY